MNTNAAKEASRSADLRQKFLDLSVWAMTLIMGLILEQASGPVVAIFGAPHAVDIQVWAALAMMSLVFGLMLATLVGILALHVRFRVEYSYWFVVLDNVLVTAPLFVAVRFMATSVGSTSVTAVHLDENLFRIGAALIAVSYVGLSVRDAVTLRKVHVFRRGALFGVGAMHILGALLFFMLAAIPGLIVAVAFTGWISLILFFAVVLIDQVIPRLFRPEVAAAVDPLGARA